MLSLPRLKGYSERQVEEVVRLNDKQRFALKRDGRNRFLIRANQGHTIKVRASLKSGCYILNFPLLFLCRFCFLLLLLLLLSSQLLLTSCVALAFGLEP